MRRRYSPDRPPIPAWVLGGNVYEDQGERAAYQEAFHRWCDENGWSTLEALIAQRDARHARLGIGWDGDDAA